MIVHIGQAVESDSALPVTIDKTLGFFPRQEEEVVNFRREAVKDRRIAKLEKHNCQLDIEVESLLAEKQRKLSPVSPPDNKAWFLD